MAYELSLYDYFRIVKKRKFVVFFTFIVVMISTWIFTNMQTPVYKAQATIKIEPSLIVPGVSTEMLGWDMLTALDTEVKIIKSSLIAERTAKKLGLINDFTPETEKQAIIQSIESKTSAERITGTSGTTNLVNIIAISSNKKEVEILANATAKVYIEKGIEDRTRRARELREFIEKQLFEAETKLKKSEDDLKKFTEQKRISGIGGNLAVEITNLEIQKQELLKKYTQQHPEIVQINRKINILQEQLKQLPKEEIEYARLTRELKLNEDLYTLLAKKYKEAQISEADRIQAASIITPAIEPDSPIKPNKFSNFSIGSVLGIFLGLIFAFVIEHLDTSIGTIEDVESYLKLPVLGVIPHIEAPGVLKHSKKNLFLTQIFSPKQDKLSNMKTSLLFYHSTKSPFTESYHTLRTNIKLVNEEFSGNCLLFTSSGVNEGKTLTSLNFALAASQTGIKTLLIELDLRRPMLHKIFGIQRIPGITDCIVGKKLWQQVVRGTTDFLLGGLALEKLLQTPGIENFKLIPCGFIPHNPVDILSSEEASFLFNELKTKFELVIIDCSPVLLFADSLILSKYVDGTILVYRVGRIARGALKRAKDQIIAVKSKLLGIVLNDIKTSEMEPRYGYYYAYRYYAEKEKT